MIERGNKEIRWKIVPFILALVVLANLVLPNLRVLSILSFNRFAVETVKQIFVGKPIKIKKNSDSQECKTFWFDGLIAGSQGDLEGRNTYWRVAVQCSPKFIEMLSLIIPDDRAMAEFVVASHPETAESWFWMAQLDDERVIEFYERGLALDPTAGLRWKEYGDLIVEEDPERAIQAYLQSCLNGDPRYNGCWLAGKMAEQLGDIPRAIRYYRFSLWKGAWNRADELELELNSEQER
jgi:tetratricopeptide (TPR) repeat protein